MIAHISQLERSKATTAVGTTTADRPPVDQREASKIFDTAVRRCGAQSHLVPLAILESMTDVQIQFVKSVAEMHPQYPTFGFIDVFMAILFGEITFQLVKGKGNCPKGLLP